MRSNYQEYLAWTYFGEQAFDREEFTRLKETLQGATRFIDVGASHGVYTYHANEILRNAEIIAIEADPERFQILQENAERWAAASTNKIRCINAACSDEQDRSLASEVEFFTTGTQISGGLFSVAERSDKYAPKKVRLVCLDDFFDASRPTFVKIDVEGAELRVLKGAQRHLQAGTARFFTEISWWGDRGRGTNALDVLRFCLAHGLRVDRRLKSDYLMTPESNVTARLISVIRCLRPLGVRVAYDTIVPLRVRTWRERRQNRRRWKLWAPHGEAGRLGVTPQ